jgi:hypothetical protein
LLSGACERGRAYLYDAVVERAGDLVAIGHAQRQFTDQRDLPKRLIKFPLPTAERVLPVALHSGVTSSRAQQVVTGWRESTPACADSQALC